MTQPEAYAVKSTSLLIALLGTGLCLAAAAFFISRRTASTATGAAPVFAIYESREGISLGLGVWESGHAVYRRTTPEGAVEHFNIRLSDEQSVSLNSMIAAAASLGQDDLSLLLTHGPEPTALIYFHTDSGLHTWQWDGAMRREYEHRLGGSEAFTRFQEHWDALFTYADETAESARNGEPIRADSPYWRWLWWGTMDEHDGRLAMKALRR